MERVDEHFLGRQAEAWARVIGRRGDLVRQVVLNRVVAETLGQFTALSAETRALPVPRAFIQRALKVAALEPSNAARVGIPELTAWQDDPESFRQHVPQPELATLWDLGCGCAQVGGWLTSHGAGYVGVEPSADLINASRSDDERKNLDLVHADILRFLNDPDTAKRPPATLICVLSVLELCADPQAQLAALRQFMLHHGPSPVLVSTLDPTFFCPTPPRVAEQVVAPVGYGGALPLLVRDPARWEGLFVDAGYHVIEQRPMSLAALHPALAAQLRQEHRLSFPTARTLVPPVQGPFYLWLLAPRKAPTSEGLCWSLGADGQLSSQIFTYSGPTVTSVGEPIEATANLGAMVHTVMRGEAEFRSDPATLEMPFVEGSTFGQMELNRNYVSGRIYGQLFALKDTTLRSVPYGLLRAQIEPEADYRQKLLVSMLDHLGTVRFKNLLSHRVLKDSKSRIFGSQEILGRVRNYAAMVLQVWSDQLRLRPASSYQSTVILELTDQDIVRNSLHSESIKPAAGAKLRKVEAYECIPAFVQNGIVDCFSVAMFAKLSRGGAAKFQDDIVDRDLDDLISGGLLHIGLIVALQLDEVLRFDDDGREDELVRVALLVSALLNYAPDLAVLRQQIRSDMAADAGDAELENEPGAGRPADQRPMGSRKTRALPWDRSGIMEFLVTKCRSAASREVDPAALRTFLRLVQDEFRFQTKNGFQKDLGLTGLVVVRDVWALAACLLDEPALWSGNPAEASKEAFLMQPCQRYRLVSYFHECVAYLAAKAGLTDPVDMSS